MKKLGIQVGDRVKTRMSYKAIPKNAKGIVKALTQITAPAAEKNPFAPATINVPSFEQAPPTIKVSASPGEKQPAPAQKIKVTDRPAKSWYAAFSPERPSLRPAYVPVNIILPAPVTAPKTIVINPTPKYLSKPSYLSPGGATLPKSLQLPAPPKFLPAPAGQAISEPSQQAEELSYYLIDSLGKAELHFDYNDYKQLPAALKDDVKRFFNWSRKRSAWVSKGAWSSYTVQNLVIKKLGLKLKGKKERMSFEDQLDRKDRNQAYREGVYERRATQLEERAKALMAMRERYRGDNSFWTQPNVNTSGGRSFTKARERIIENYFKGLNMVEKAANYKEWASNLRAAGRNNEDFKNPGYVFEKLREAEKEFTRLMGIVPQSIDRLLAAGDEESIIKAEAQQDKLNNQAQKLAFFMELWDNFPETTKYDHDKLKGAKYVVIVNKYDLYQPGAEQTWYKVHKLAPKNIYYEFRDRLMTAEHHYVRNAVYDTTGLTIKPILLDNGTIQGYKIERNAYSDNVSVPPSMKTGVATSIENLPIQSISIKREWFQNRATPYSERSVQNIVDAVNAGQFNWANFDAVTVWAAPEGKIYMLSGHSRLEAFERLCKAGRQEFCTIPAKITAVTFQEAKKIALESNTLSTKETVLERAEFWRKLRLEGTAASVIEEEAKRVEGANWTTIIAYSHLYPTGKTLDALSLLQSAEATSQNNIKTIAKWIGNAIKRYPQLTVSHENELFDWLVTGRGYGTRAGQFSKEVDFSTRLAAIINKRTAFGVLDERLNIQNNVTLSPVERQYNAQLDEAKERISDLEKQLREKQADLIKRGATDAQIIELTAPINAAIQKAKLDLRRLIDNREEVANYAKQEQNLFSNLSGRKRRGFKLFA